MANQEIEQAVAAQREYFAGGNTRPFDGRVEALGRLEQCIVDHRDDILEALAADLGKPGVEAYVAEYHFLLEELRMIKKSLEKWLRPKRVRSPFYLHPCRSEVHREPYGTALIMAPWNYPVQLALSPLIAAAAAGNTAVLKPSELSPSCETLLQTIVEESFPPEHVCVRTGDAGVAERLLEQRFDFVFFTGSTAVGRKVAVKAAQHLAPCVLELGGKCPALVHESANLGVAAERVLTGKFFNGGQTCFAPDFVAVHESVKDGLVAEMRRVFEDVTWNGEMSRVINRRHYDRLARLLSKDQEIIQQGEDRAESLNMAPRIIPGAAWGDRIMEEEIFGPILPVVSYGNENDLISRLSRYGSPLALYLFADDRDFCREMMGRIRSGGVCVNDTMKQGAHLRLPFGGVGESGYGRYRGKSGVLTFCYERAVVRKPAWGPDWFDPKPPYGDKLKWLKRFMR